MNNLEYLDFLKTTDPEYYKIVEVFTKETRDEVELDEKDAALGILATLIGSQAVLEFKLILGEALKVLTPEEIKETVYQGTAYLGLGRVLPFVEVCNEVFKEKDITLPLKPLGSGGDRLKEGAQAQVDIFGEGMKDFYRSGPEDRKQINLWLARNCFGDYYTRGGLDLRQRELITFCFLAAQGGCEPQLIGHAAANLKVGNGKDVLIALVSRNLPYIGYPRSLNALSCIDKAYENA